MISRKTKEITIGEGKHQKVIELKELVVKDVLDLFNSEEQKPDTGLDNFLDSVKRFLPLCSNLDYDDLIGMSPSQLKALWEAFKEVNEVFFEVAATLGLQQVVERIKKAVIEDLLNLFSNSLKQDIPTV